MRASVASVTAWPRALSSSASAMYGCVSPRLPDVMMTTFFFVVAGSLSVPLGGAAAAAAAAIFCGAGPVRVC